MTKDEKIIQEINMLNNTITFKLVPAISEALSQINMAHGRLMNKYKELVDARERE